MTERNDWYITATGKQVYLLDPEPSKICITDIAHALAHICRFGGHVPSGHYSVAQHSVIVSHIVPPELALVGLLHDAPEAYLGDVIRPLKRILAPLYEPLEESWWRAICLRFGLPEAMPDEVKHADRIALVTERRDLIPWEGFTAKADESGFAAWPEDIVPLPADVAREAFITRFHELGGQHHNVRAAAE